MLGVFFLFFFVLICLGRGFDLIDARSKGLDVGIQI